MHNRYLVLFVAVTDAWTTSVVPSLSTISHPLLTSRSWMSEMANMPGEMDEWTPEMQAGDNPCWQDLYDDDCSMTSVFSASFVASKWIKSMPCGAGIEDCDMPESLSVPNAKENGVAAVDVMAFLGLKHRDPPNELVP